MTLRAIISKLLEIKAVKCNRLRSSSTTNLNAGLEDMSACADVSKVTEVAAMANSRLAAAVAALMMSAATAFGALSSTFNSLYDVGVTASSYTASDTLTVVLNFSPTPWQQLLLVNNTGVGIIIGNFFTPVVHQGQSAIAAHLGNFHQFTII